ncbi:hypothetical protein WN944_029299 [Citrus x changshan-huyou]
MGFRLPGIVQAKKILRQSSFKASQSAMTATEVPKGYLAVYVGENEMKRFMIPVSYLNQSPFQDLLSQAEEEFGFHHPMGAMAIRFLRIVNAKQALRRALMVSEASTVPKGHLAVYVGEIEKSRFVVPVSYLKHPSFQNLLSQAEEEFGFDHPMGGLTIPCSEKVFMDLTSRL